PFDLACITERNEEDVLQKRLEGNAKFGLSHQAETAVGLSVKSLDAAYKTGLLCIEASQLHRPFYSICPVIDKEAVLQISGRYFAEQLGECASQWIKELLAR